MRDFFAELKRRKVYRVAFAYTVAGWLIIQIATQVFPPLEIPNWIVKLTIAVVVIGFPIALISSWAFDFTMQGIKRTEEIEEPIAASVPEKSIAVLPFENLSDDQRNTYLADGIQDDILSNLAKVADLKVISRTSVRQYRGSSRNLREIGDTLGVAHILEGTVRRVDNRVRVVAQLINARTDSHIWSDTFDRELTDLFELQSELAQKIATALRANISPREKAGLQVHPTAHLDAYDLYLQARDLFRWSGAGDPRTHGEKAVELLDQALARDPEFALAHALASRFHSELHWFGFDRCSQRIARAKAEAERALQLRPEMGDAHLALAYYYYYGHREYELARHELGIAQRATPNDAEVWDTDGSLDRRQGRWPEALANFRRARQLDPRNVAVIWNVGETCLCLERYDEAEEAFAAGLTINPRAELFALVRASTELKKNGQTAPLRAALEKVSPQFDPGGAVTSLAIRVCLMERDHASARRWLERSPLARLNDAGIGGVAATLDGYSFPRSWFEGLIARCAGETEEAQRAFRAAEQEVQQDFEEWPDDGETIVLLGLTRAALGQKESAIELGRRATELLPISRDAYDGPVIAANLAAIYAQVGENDHAIDQLVALLKVPNGVTPGLLRVEPEWDSLRDDARFQTMAAGRAI